jgi:copper chaperone CopZ
MTHTYHISGMTCSKCVAKVKSELLKIGDITEAEIQLESPQATIHMQQHISTPALQAAISKAGAYTITEADAGMHATPFGDDTKSWWQTYKPVLLIFFYVTVISLVAAFSNGQFDIDHFMRIFMSGFFLSFSFFKMLDLDGFADSYSTYDIIAKHFRPWAYIYAFIELGLGIAFAMNIAPLLVNAITLVVMTISIIGVLQAVLNKRKIQCACLGAVFNLPMSTVTIIEDALMILMSAVMLIQMI